MAHGLSTSYPHYSSYSGPTQRRGTIVVIIDMLYTLCTAPLTTGAAAEGSGPPLL